MQLFLQLSFIYFQKIISPEGEFAMSTLTREDKKFYIVVAITALIMYGFGFLPTFGQVSPQGMKILGIFLGCIFAWCFGELVWSH